MKNRAFCPTSISPRNRCRLLVELLESRCLLSASWPVSVGFQALEIDYNSFHTSSVLVRYRDGAVADGQAVGLVSGLHEVFVDEGMDVASAVAKYKANPDVLYVQPNYRVGVNLIPNDPLFPQLYGMHNTGQSGGTVDADIDAPEVWDNFTGSSSVIVAVIDTGVDYNHPDLAANMWINTAEIPSNGIDDDGNGVVDDIHGANFVDPYSPPTGNPFDDHGHGTHVAGTIGAVGNNGIGVAGVAWNVRIMALKFLDAGGGGYISGAIKSLNYAVQMGATISNNSWGGGGPDQAMRDAIANAASQDHLFIAAAGNDGSNNDSSPFYPAGYNVDNIIAVAATNRGDQLAGFSNYGATTVHLGAPGVDIVSTVPTSGALGHPSGYTSLSGTSMATPHVAGVAALVRGLHPEWTYQQVKDQILGTVDPIPALQGKTITGGRLNAAAAGTGTPPPPPPDTGGPRVTASSPAGAVTGSASSVRFTFNERVDAITFTTDDVSFSGPLGSIPVTGVAEVAGSNGRQFDVAFAEQSGLGTYTITLGPDIYDTATVPNPMNQDGDGINGEIPADQYTGSFTIADDLVYASTDVPVPILDYTVTVSYLNITDTAVIGDLNVQIDLTHTWVGDLFIFLIAPNGEFVSLSYGGGGSGDNFTNTTFDDEASLHISQGFAPFTGAFRPEGSLSWFDESSVQGEWALWIEDWGFGDEGTLLGWSLIVQPGGGQPPPPPPPPPPNEPPVAVDDYLTIDEDQSVIVNVLANDYDPEGGELTITSIDYVEGGTANITADGKIAFTATPNYNGWGYVAYTIADPAGLTASAWAYIEILPVDDPPIAVDDFATASMNTELWFDGGWWGNPPPPSENDIDADGDWLWITSVDNAVNGSVRLEYGEGGIVVFTPANNFLGTSSFQYTVTDGTYSATGTVTVAVNAYYYISLAESGTIDGLSFTGSDILQLEIGGGGQYSYSTYFKGSDYGLTTASENIDAFTLLPDGSILISTLGSFTVPRSGGGNFSGNGEDLILWNPWDKRYDFYFDGSDVGLSGVSENIDAVALLDDGRILISTAGNFSAGGVTGLDEDLFAFYPYSLGAATSGYWEMYFDGSDVGLATNDNEDINGVFVETTGGLPILYFSTLGNFAVAGVSGANEDIVRFRPTRLGPNTAGSFGPGLKFDGSLYGLASFNIDDFHLGRAIPLSAFSMASARSFRAETVEAAALQESRPATEVAFELSATPSMPAGTSMVNVPVAPVTFQAASPNRSANHRAVVDRLFAEAGRSQSDGDESFDLFADLEAVTDAWQRHARRRR